jgi:SAM-dependent methyltransferase
MHVTERDEHFPALFLLIAAIDFLQNRSILNIGSGTGRAVRYIKKYRPDICVVGLKQDKGL